MYTWALTVTSVQVCTASSGVNETAANSLCIPSAHLEPFFFFAFPAFFSLHLRTSPARSTPPPPSVRPPSSITSEGNRCTNLVRVSGTHRRLTADSVGPSATTVLISCDIRVSLQSLWSRQGVGWDELMADWPIYTPVTWSLTPPQARNIKLTAAYFEMCDRPGGCRHSGLSALYF